jgi:hypothetical protein
MRQGTMAGGARGGSDKVVGIQSWFRCWQRNDNVGRSAFDKSARLPDDRPEQAENQQRG